MRTIRRTAAPVLILLVFGMMSCETMEPQYSREEIVGYSYSSPAKLADGWEIAAPNPERLAVSTLEEGVRAIMRGEYPHIHSILIAQSSKLVFEEYFPGYSFEGRWKEFDQSVAHSLQSLTKSITALVMGVAIDREEIDSIDSCILDWYPEYDHTDRAEKQAITLRHLLTMQSGFEWNEWAVASDSRTNDLNRHYRARRPFGYLLTKPLADAPGTRFTYNTASTNLLGDIVRRSTGEPFHDYARRYLFDPLGINKVSWLSWKGAPTETVATGGGLRLTPRDVLKIGQLVLQNGIWKGRPIVSQLWLSQALHPQVAFSPNIDYGFLWWLPTELHPGTQVALHPYVAGGTGGQWLFVYPEQDLVIVTTGGSYSTDDDTCIRWLQDYLLAAMTVHS